MRSGPARSFDVTAQSTARPDRIWALLLDARSWPEWSPIDALVADRSENLSDTGHDEIGAIRAFRTGRVVTGERIIGLQPERLLRYEDAWNPVLHDYVASVELTPSPSGGSSLRWHGTYATAPGLGVLIEWYLRRFMQRMVDGLAIATSDPSPSARPSDRRSPR